MSVCQSESRGFKSHYSRYMSLSKKFPITPGSRHSLRFPKYLLSQERPLKKLKQAKVLRSGRNSQGKITVRHRGGRGKILYRKILFNPKSYTGIVLGIEYDPFRTAFIARVFDLRAKSFFYTLANSGLYPGSKIECSPETLEIRIGNRTQLKNLPTGSIVSLISNKANSKILFCRSGGTFCQLLQKTQTMAKLRLPSGKVVNISSLCFGTLGSISNNTVKLEVKGKAGINRYLGWRPSVRGVAMNPVDHPHGGGEGKTSGGRPSVTPWGRPVGGKKKKKKNV